MRDQLPRLMAYACRLQEADLSVGQIGKKRGSLNVETDNPQTGTTRGRHVASYSADHEQKVSLNMLGLQPQAIEWNVPERSQIFGSGTHCRNHPVIP